MAYIFTVIFISKLLSNLLKIFLCIAWHQKPTVISEDLLYSTEYPQYRQQSLYKTNSPYGQAYYHKGAKGTYYCTIMASIPCLKVPYFSSVESDAIIVDGYYQNFGSKVADNAKWIRENRFALAGKGDESEKCETVIGTSKKVR